MRRTEEFKVLGIVTLTLVLLLIFCLGTSEILAFLLLGFIGVLVGLAHIRYIKKERMGPADERSREISLVATRNGFLAVILLLTFDAIAGHLYPSLTSITDISIIAWGLGVFVYITTYLVGIRGTEGG
jgi:hypothetical protein